MTVWNFVKENSLLLIIGALIALYWGNTNPENYHHFVETMIWDHALIGHAHLDGNGHVHRSLTLHFLINDVLMALFFAIAGKEVWEAVALKNGSLRGKKAATPLIATAGGMFGPITVYLGLAAILGKEVYEATANGWAIPTATDIAFSYLVGRLVFGPKHPAIAFLLLLAIADDAAGLVILAIFYPQGTIEISWMLLPIVAMAFNYFVLQRFFKVVNFWPYLIIGGSISWIGFHYAGIHPALGLLPIIPTMAHADSDLGIFARQEKTRDDTLNAFEHRMAGFVQVILFFFALANAGVAFSAIGEATWLVLAGLLLGKPFGILFFGWLAARPLGLGIPEGMKISDLFVIGCVAAIGFTVSLFVASVAFPPSEVQDAAKMGALFSFIAAVLSLIAGKFLRVERKV